MPIQQTFLGLGADSSPFPTAYKNLIANYSASNTRYYDISNGNDSNNGQTEATAKQNLGSDLNSWLNGSNGRIAVIMPGTYPITNHTPGSYGNRMLQWDTNSKCVCAPGQVTITSTSAAARDFHVFGMRNADAGIYGAIIKRNNGGRTNNYSRAMWGYDASATSGDVYNCVIEETNGNNAMSHIYDNSNSGNRYMERSTIVADMVSPYSCGTSLADNIAMTFSSSQFCPSGNNFKYNVTFTTSPSGNPYYINNNTSDNATYGVYGGTYSWKI